MATEGMNWNDFRKHHKGIDKEEISALWQQYKDGEYDPDASTNIDPNHGHDLDYIAEVEEEMSIEEENEEQREPKQQEFLNELNNEEKSKGLKSITHW